MKPGTKLRKAAKVFESITSGGRVCCACHAISVVEHGEGSACWSLAPESNAYPYFALFDPYPDLPTRSDDGTGRLWWPLSERDSRITALLLAAAIADSEGHSQFTSQEKP